MASAVRHFYEFGRFRLDEKKLRLTREGEIVPLSRKDIESLVVLVRNPGKLLEREELMQAVWGDTVVEDANLTVAISHLRKALETNGDAAEYIETIPRVGYRFVAPVREVREEPTSLVIEKHTLSQTVIEEDLLSGPAEGRLSLNAMFRSIAVLPFKSLGSDEGDNSLGLWMADALITKLSNLKQVIIRPTSAVRKYAGLAHNPIMAAQELMVESVLEGNIQRAGERIRVTVQLVAAHDGATCWSHKFDGKFTDIFSVQDAISEQVMRALMLKLSAEEMQRSRKHHTTSFEAYDAYSKGRFFWDKRSEYGFNKAIEFFKKAIELDPEYALAYAGLADTYIIQGLYDLLPPKPTFLEAKENALKALELDPTLGEAHTSLAAVELFCHWNFTRAEEGFLRALDLNPNHTIAHLEYADLLSAAGRHEEGISEMRYAQSLDPLNLGLIMNVGDHLSFARHYDEAVEWYQKTLEMEPNFIRAYLRLALTYMRLGNPSEAGAMLESAKALAGGKEEPLAWFAHVYAASGRRAEALRALSQLNLQAEQDYVPAYVFAVIYAALGELDEAFVWLNKACEDRSGWMIFIAVDPVFEALQSDMRFTHLLRGLGDRSTLMIASESER
jgi:DNA-binding winged helix-turn-helix (wHTH) protein/TolB-like protein/Tfp pilus assembly protein PilF